MKAAPKHPESILLQEAFGFSLLIAISWLTETFDLPHFLFQEPPTFHWQRALLRTGVIIVIWIWVHLATKKVLQRLYYLEEFLLVCSWCRKVGYQGEWLTMEEYFGSKFDVSTSHGICPECARKATAHLPAAPTGTGG